MVVQEKNYKILIIGELENSDFPEILKQTGNVTVMFASSGEEGLKIAFNSKPDYVFLTESLKGKIDRSTTANILFEAYGIPVLFLAAENEYDSKFLLETPFEVVFIPVTLQKLKFQMERAKLSLTRYKTLSERAEITEKILSNTTGFAIVLDDLFFIKYINEGKNKKLTGSIELAGKKILDFLDEENSEKLVESVNKLECGTSSRERITLAFNFNEATINFTCDVSCVFGSDGKNEYILNCFPVHIAVEETDKENELVSVLENVPYGVALLSGDKFDFVNSEFIRITGYGLDELGDLQNWFEKMFPDESYRRVVTDVWNQEINRKNIIKTLSIQCKNGDIKQIDFRAKKIDSGKYIISILDITEQKKTREELDNYIHQLKLSKNSIEQKNIQLEKLNKELRESEEKLLELNRDKDKFFSILAHDLRTPFNAILGLSQLVAEDYDELSKEEVVKIVKDINNAGKNLFRLLENLLNWSRITSGRAEFNPEKVDLYELVLTAIHLLKPNADAKELTIENNVKPDTYVFVDEQMIESVIENLLTNAIKFTPRGGKISINISEQPGKYEVSVSDTGIGISKENINKLFRIDVPFSEYGTEKEKGSGLGLILCKESVEKHNGEIWVESEEGKGSTFYFTVPKAE